MNFKSHRAGLIIQNQELSVSMSDRAIAPFTMLLSLLVQENQDKIILQKCNMKSGIYFGRLTGKGSVSGTLKMIVD